LEQVAYAPDHELAQRARAAHARRSLPAGPETTGPVDSDDCGCGFEG
ncbi:tRNA pseudouridine(38-40) synthase TruA, partial [Propionibacterium freudenreichii]|nr:tRNA pseudouridine(38-40) synthase TruA [Propionibacterium freudenreichii]